MIKVLRMHVQNNTIQAVLSQDNTSSSHTLTFYWDKHWQRHDRAYRVTKCTVSFTSTERVVIKLALTPEESKQTLADSLIPQPLVGEMWRAVQKYLRETDNNVGKHNAPWLPQALEFITGDKKFIVAIEQGRIRIGK